MIALASEFGAVDTGPFLPVSPEGVDVVRDASGGLGVALAVADGSFVARVTADRRGLVLEVGRAESVHVNGRPVREWSLLRCGDVMVISRKAFLVRACRVPEPAGEGDTNPVDAGATRSGAWLRCVGGRQSGQIRSVSIARTLPWWGDRGVLATVGNERGIWVARAVTADGLAVDGHPVSYCVLHGGEQLAAGEGRWVLECNGSAEPEPSANKGAVVPTPETAAPSPTASAIEPVSNPGARFSPLWLIIAALAVAAALVGLLWSMR